MSDAPATHAPTATPAANAPVATPAPAAAPAAPDGGGVKQGGVGPGQISLAGAQVERGNARPGGIEIDKFGNDVTIIKVDGNETFSDPRDATKAMRAARAKAYGEETPQPTSRAPRMRASDVPELKLRGLESDRPAPEPPSQAQPPQVASDAPEEEPVESTAATSESVEPPPLAAPQSWTQEEKDEFQTYPRTAQEAILRREQDRQRQFTQRQQELAEQRRTLDTAKQEADRQRDEYETRVIQSAQALHQQVAANFPEIKTQDDIERLAVENPPRFNSFLLASMKANNATTQAQAMENQRNARIADENAKWARDQDRLFTEKVPHFTPELRSQTRPYLETVGFSKEEIDHHWNTTGMLRDHRAQQMIADALIGKAIRTGEIRKTIEAKVKNVPPVMKPGTSRPVSADPMAEVRALEKQMAEATTTKEQLRISAKLTQARRAQGLLSNP